MPKFAVDRATAYYQWDTVVVEADDHREAVVRARQQEDPEFNHEYVERAKLRDRYLNPREVE